MAGHTIHRLEGLEPDNLLAFMALLGLLRALEAARPSWYARVFWTVDEPPLRPALRVPAEADKTAVAEAAAEGLNDLAKCHDFEGLKDLALESGDAARRLRKAAAGAGRPPYAAELWSALVSDAAVTRDGVKGGADTAVPPVWPGAPAFPGATCFGSAAESAASARKGPRQDGSFRNGLPWRSVVRPMGASGWDEVLSMGSERGCPVCASRPESDGSEGKGNHAAWRQPAGCHRPLRPDGCSRAAGWQREAGFAGGQPRAQRLFLRMADMAGADHPCRNSRAAWPSGSRQTRDESGPWHC